VTFTSTSLGSFSPARPPIIDFHQWTNNFDLFHIPTRGAFFTWDNGRSGRRHTKRRLDRAIGNQNLLDLCSTVSCITLTKIRSDHFPLLLELKTDNQTFTSSFKFMSMWDEHKDSRKFIEDNWNAHVVGCPKHILNIKLKKVESKIENME